MNYQSILGEDYIKDIADYLQMCQVAFWIMVVISLIVLIAFLILCNNISKIRKSIYPKNKFSAIFNFYYSIGEMDKAKEYLFQEICKDDYLDEAFLSTADYHQRSQKYFEEKYGKYLKVLGLSVDFNKADDFIKEILK